MAGCEVLTECGRCLWDASDIASGFDISCQWCSAQQLCVADAKERGCEQFLTFDSPRQQCPDLQCHLSPISFNVYVCQTNAVFVFWWNVTMLLLTLLFYLWHRTISQRPWRIPGLKEELRKVWHDDTQVLESRVSLGDREMHTSLVLESDTGEVAPLHAQGECCPSYEPDDTCTWCRLARMAFLPLLVAGITCATNIFTVLGFSLRSFFFIPYAAFTSSIPPLAYIFFALIVYRSFQCPHTTVWDKYYLRLAVVLRGRSITSVFPALATSSPRAPTQQLSHTHRDTEQTRKGAIGSLPQFPDLFSNWYDRFRAVTPLAFHTSQKTSVCSDARAQGDEAASQTGSQSGPSPVPPAPSNPMVASSSAADFHQQSSSSHPVVHYEESESERGSLWSCDQDLVDVEEDVLVRLERPCPVLVRSGSDEMLRVLQNADQRFLSKLRKILVQGSDEAVLWCETPPFWHVVLHERFFVHLAGALLVFFICLTAYASGHAHTNKASIMVIGIALCIALSAILFCFIASCKRMHVITTHRACTLSCGFLGEVYAVSYAAREINCVLVKRYIEFGQHICVLSWQQPRGVTRRMPALPSAQFVCVKNVDDLLHVIKKYYPPLSAKHWEGALEALKAEWRVYMGVVYWVLLILLSMFHYSALPNTLILLTLICALLASVAVYLQGIRNHTTTWEPIENKKPWSTWRKPRWVTKEVVKKRQTTGKGLPNSETEASSSARRPPSPPQAEPIPI